jgi:hypothetical protein
VTQVLVWLGGLSLVALALSSLMGPLRGWLEGRRRQRSVKKAEKLDWALIDNTLNAVRPRRDCERQESLGICTGKDCLVYDTCDFNIKKVVH